MKKIQWHVRVSAENRRRLAIGGSVLLALFVLANIVVGVMYRDRTYPGTTVMGNSIGNVSFSDLAEATKEAARLPDSLQLVHGDQKATVGAAQLGLTLDIDSVQQSVQRQRSWVPLVDLLRAAPLEPPLRVSNLAKLSPEFAAQLRRDATNARLTLNGVEVGIAPEETGYVLDESLLERSILGQVAKGKSTIDVPIKAIAPRVKASDLEGPRKELVSRLATSITYRYEDNLRSIEADEVAAWYVQSGEIFEIDDAKLQAFIEGIGDGFNMRVKDVTGAVVATKKGLESKKSTVVVLSKQPASRVFKYCVAVRGISESHLAGLKSQLRGTFTDPRGWSMKGLIEFQEVAAGCDFTVWLASASSIPTFSSACDAAWSCRVGPNVIANFDLWQNASTAWQGYGGSIEDYRHMTINHETGHWFGFDHSGCTGAGHKAPVMQQQSMDLGGCVFSPWPNAFELESLRQSLKI